MARYKTIDLSPRFLAVDLEKQLLPVSFSHAVHHLLEHDFDLSGFATRYRNDETGASAYPPGMLPKVILCAYAEGVVSSRGIERLCREHVTFIALSGDSAPHYTTLAAFVSGLGDEVATLFAEVLYLCDRQGLIGGQMFAIDGIKLSSNASKGRRGTRADFTRQAEKLETAAKAMLERHRENDAQPTEPDLAAKTARRIERLNQDAAQLRHWLAEHPNERKGSKGSIRKSNRTDPDSAKMATSKGVIQGYCGVAAVDEAHQIIVEVSFFRGKANSTGESDTDRMKRAIDSAYGRQLYGRRFATVEPVFGNLRHNKRLNRFTSRGQKKVDTQWKLYCLVHNIEKVAHHGYGVTGSKG